MQSLRVRLWRGAFKRLRASIGAKIVLPYLLLTLVVAGVGAFVIVRLVTSSWQERFHNQLLDTGRVVSESMVDFEEERLEVLRVVIGTDGVPTSLATGDRAGLAARVPQIIANSNTDAVELLDKQGREVYGWQRPPHQIGHEGEERAGADYGQVIEVRRVLDGYVDEFGEKRVLLNQTPYGLMIFTVGPVYQNDELVGAVLVGTYIREMVEGLAEIAVARVTLYDQEGNVMATTFGGGQPGVAEVLQESSEQYRTTLTLLRESPNRHPVVVTNAESEVPLRRVQVLGQDYSLAFGDWRLRGQSLGLFSVALPSNFILSTAATSRNILGLLFSTATVGVFALGYAIAQRIIRPLSRLVQTSVAVAQGDLAQRTGIQRDDEIGSLAHSFDVMTDRLVERNRQLVEQASKLEAILDSTAEGIIVLDRQGVVITSNRAAQRILTDVSSDFLTDILRDLSPAPWFSSEGDPEVSEALELARLQQPRRHQIGSQIFSAQMAPVKTPGGEPLGTVIVLRDVSREAEAEQLKDSFITSISHELRTPLTSIKGYSDLLLMTADGSLSEQQSQFVKTINSNANKLVHHINEIIDISEVQAGTLNLNNQEMSISELVEEMAERWRKRLGEKGLSLQVRLPGEELWVDGDPKRLTWALNNLLSNACNYTLTGGVEVRLYREGEDARLDVIDTGVGVAVADQPYLFTRFFRASPHQAMFDVAGVGLGLFITRSIIELHQGKIWAESKLDVGSTFSLALPLLKRDITVN